jgi:hypothetical protein
MSDYDSRPDTYAHMQLVARNIGVMIRDLLWRAEEHDQSKLSDPELTAFNEIVPNLARAEYGSEEYRAALRAQKPAIQHHYAANSHHPEHYANGIPGMNLLDVLEMLCDWEAAARRKDGHARESMDHNQARFGFSDELKAILLNTLPLIEGEP